VSLELDLVPGGLARTIEELPLVDHHVHGASALNLSRSAFEELITESDRPVPEWMTQFDSQVGYAILRHCAPVLGLDPYCTPEEYLARRARLGVDEVNRLLLGATGVRHFLVETGYRGDEVLGPSGMAEASGVPADEVVRLETVAEQVAAGGCAAGAFAGRFEEALWERGRTARGLKTVAAYRYGLDFDPARPAREEVAEAAGRWFAAGGRLTDPVLLRHLIWTGLDRGLPLQIHVGFGDPDVDLRRADPLLLRGLIELAEPTGGAAAVAALLPVPAAGRFPRAGVPERLLRRRAGRHPHRGAQCGAGGREPGGGPVREDPVLVRRVGAGRAALPGGAPVAAGHGARPRRVRDRWGMVARPGRAGGRPGGRRERPPRLPPGRMTGSTGDRVRSRPRPGRTENASVHKMLSTP
jgi:hypothetical protein